MNPILLLKSIHQTVKLANEIASEGGEGPRWSWFLTNRSFIAAVIGVVLTLLTPFGIQIPFAPEYAAEGIFAAASAGAFLWSFGERLFGKTRAVYNPTQAHDALTEALAVAMAHAPDTTP